MNIKNIRRYVRKTSLSVWTKYELFNARSYDEVKDILMVEIWLGKAGLRKSPYEQHKIYEKRIRQAKNILRLMGINA